MGKTIMISSHILTELAEMCTHIGIIERGNLLASGDVTTIMRSLQPHRVFEVQVALDPEAPGGAAAALEAAAALVRGQPHVLEVRALPDDTPPHLQVDFDGDDRAVSALLGRLIAGGAPVTHFAGQVSDLEEIFLRVTEESAYGGTA
jgi:ABC-2 type transport system ATP-binding protein